MDFLRLFETEKKRVFSAATSGGRYAVEAFDNCSYRETTGGRGTAGGGTNNMEALGLRMAQLVHDSKLMDKINYIIHQDDLGVQAILDQQDPAKVFPARLINIANEPELANIYKNFGPDDTVVVGNVPPEAGGGRSFRKL